MGLMCLYIFVDGNKQQYEALKPSAMKLGSAFQKVNFLRDLKDDYQVLGRTYFPNVDITSFDNSVKEHIENDIQQEFREALKESRIYQAQHVSVFILPTDIIFLYSEK